METSKVSSNVMNLSMPRGALSFAPLNDSGVMTGEIDLGNVTSFDITDKTTYKPHMTSHDSIVVLDAKKISEALREVKFVPEERSAENMALFFFGDPDANKTGGVTQPGGHITWQDFVPYSDRWIDLGKKYIKPNSIVLRITPGSGTPISLSDLTDNNGNAAYKVDYENGLLMIKSTETNVSFTDGMAGVTVNFHYGTAKLKDFVTRIRPMVGFLRYRGLSEAGPRHSVKCWKVQITPDAPLNMIKPTDYATLGFAGDVYIDDDTGSHKAAHPFYQVEELDTALSYPS